ncbi:MAG: hypothetical protein AB8G15_01705 [Saprospiraceae bacterium]
MSFQKSTYPHSKVYQQFKEIQFANHRELVRFFESNKAAIFATDLMEYFELLVAYASALFEIGRYEDYLNIADEVIEFSIAHNIKFFKGEDVYQKFLFKKAAAYYNLMSYGQSEYILKELIKMNPNDELVIQFLKKCKSKKTPKFLHTSRAASIFLFIFAGGIIAVEILFIRNFMPTLTQGTELLRNCIFAFGILLLVGAELAHRYRIYRQTHQFVKKHRKIKAQSRAEKISA